MRLRGELLLKSKNGLFFFLFPAIAAVLLASCPVVPGDAGKTEDGPGQGEQYAAGLLGKVIIMQAYGTGNKTDGGISHSFIELYNKSGTEAYLDGYSLQYSEGGKNWTVIDLSGKAIPAGHSFLVMGKKMNERNTGAGYGLLQLDPAKADIYISSLQMNNNAYKILLVKDTGPTAVKNPFDSGDDQSGAKVKGYVDLLGANDTDKEKNIDAFETAALSNSAITAPYYASKGKSVRRVDLIDSDDNARDFEQIEWRSSASGAIKPGEFEIFRPRSTIDGQWNPESLRSPPGGSDAELIALAIAGQAALKGSPAASWSAVSKPGSAAVTSLTASSVPVGLTIAAGASFRTAKAGGTAVPQWDSSASPVYSFANGDILYIEVTSKNGRVVNVYKIAITVTKIESAVSVSGSYTLNINSTIPQERVIIEAHTSADASALAARAEADRTKKTWTLLIPSGQKIWFKVVVTDATGYTFGRVAPGGGQSYTGNAANISLTLGPFAPPELKTFTLINADAYDGTRRNKTGAIQPNGAIEFAATSYTTISRGTGHDTILDYHKLAANFTLSEGSRLYAGDTEQVSGVSANNYYQEVNFTVVAEDNARRNYQVAAPVPGSYRVVNTMSWQTQGFGVISITTTDKTLGMPVYLPQYNQAAKLNMVWNPTGTFTYMSPEGKVLEGKTEIKGHGNYSVRYAGRKSYSLKLGEAAGFDYYDYKTQKFITLPAHKRWVLLAHDGDSTRIRTTLGFEMGRRVLTNMGWQPHADWVFFFLNGEYQGVYILSEVIKIDSGRLNIGPEASIANPNGGFIVELNNTNWYGNDIMNQNSQFIFDDLYTFMTSHHNPVRNTSGNVGSSGTLKQQGVAFSFSAPDENLGWYHDDPPSGSGTLTYSNTTHFPRKGIALVARLGSGSAYSRGSAPPANWTVPDNFGQPSGMGTAGMMPAGVFGQSSGGIYGSRTLESVYPAYNASAFVKMAKKIQDAEDSIYARNYGTGGSGGYHAYIDIDSFIDWQIAQEMCSNWEVIALNGQFMHYDASTGKLKMGPVWDLDNGWNGNDNNADPGFIRKAPFWYKELLGWEMYNDSGLWGTDRADRKDAYYASRLKSRWEAVRVQFNAELDPYINAVDARFSRITPYSNQPVGLGGSRSNFKNIITNRRNALDPAIRGY